MSTVIQTPYLRLRETRSMKLSRGASGIRFAVLADPERIRLFVTVIANEGGGNWNREVVAFAEIERVLASSAQGEPFTAKIFRAVFAGKSSNNAGFLAAALVHEGLVAPAIGTKHKLVRCGDWTRWKGEMLALDGEAILIPPVLADAVNTPNATLAAGAEHETPDTPAQAETAEVPITTTRKNQRGKNRLITVPQMATTPDGGDSEEEGRDASHP